MALRRASVALLFVCCAVGAASRSFAATDLFAAVPGTTTGTVLRFSGDTGAQLGSFVAAGSGGLKVPAGMVFGPNGALYVADGDLGVLRYNGITGAFFDVFVSRLANGGIAPRAICFGPDGNLYTSIENSQVTAGGVNRFKSADGSFLGAFVPLGGGVGLGEIHSMTFGPDGNLYVTDFSFGGVRRFNGTTGAFIDVFIPPSGPGMPAGVAFAPDGSLYVAENETGVVQHYNGASGLFLNTLTPVVASPHFDLEGLAFGPDGNLYVSDFTSGGGGVFRFDGKTGAFIDVFVPPADVLSPYILFGPCTTGQGSLCASDSRFRVTTSWRTPGGATGIGQPAQLTADTGDFWFFSSTNIEMVGKVLNGCALNGHFWFFAGGLTNVRVTIKVEDTLTGLMKTYTNPQNTAFLPIQDTNAFATCSAADVVAARQLMAPTPAAQEPYGRQAARERIANPQPGDAAAATSCSGLCLNNSRFQVTAHWTTSSQSGTGTGVGLTSDTGYLWFFNPANVEALVKVLDGCGFNGHYWVFAGGLTDVKVDLTITDTKTGTSRVYHNPQGAAFQPIQDTGAFAACP